MKSQKYPCLALVLLLAACALPACNDAGPDAPDAPEESPIRTVTQPVVDASGPNWFVAGGDGFLEMVGGTDGEPDQLTGRFALDGNVILNASAGADRWIVTGVGQIQALDSTALRLAEARDVLQGESVTTIASGPNGWLIGGTSGRVQTLDAFGEPTTNEETFLDGVEVVGAVHNGFSWIIAGGNSVAVADGNLNVANASGQAIDGMTEIRAIVGVGEFTGGGARPVYVFGPNTLSGVSALGTPSSATMLDANLDISTAVYAGSKIVVGTSDGRFGFFDDQNRSFSWSNVLGGAKVLKIEWSGTEYLVLGEGGKVQPVSAAGVPGALVQLPSTRDPVAAWFSDNRWLIAIGEIGFVLFRGEDLSELRTVSTVLGGSAVLAGDAGLEGMLVGGEGGKIRAFDGDGAPLGETATSEAGADINAVSFNGTVFLTAGNGGWAQMAGSDGDFMGSALSYLDGNDIHFVVWNGETWLVGGAGNQVQRVRADGSEAGTPLILEGVANLYDARWNGSKWLVVGESAEGTATYAFVSRDGSIDREAEEIAGMNGPAYAAEFTGSEFLVGGTGGLIQRVTNEGLLNQAPFDALNGYDILDIYFNGSNFMVGGRFGALRRLSPAVQPLRVPISVLDQRDVNVILWTRNRGFSGGVCINETSCYEGPCVGGLVEGKCCDSACDRACESCFNRDTGEADGTCAPVVAGKQPPIKPDGPSNPCPRESEATCGRTGVCDGGGECAFYGAEIQCGEPSCSNNDFTPVSTCDSAGACAVAQSTSCAPYVGCNIENGCQTACAANTDCIEGYICSEDVCVEEDSENPESRPDGGDESDDGCSTVPGDDVPTEPVLLVMAGLGFFAARRRR